MPEEAAQAVLDLKGKVLVPIHWGIFNLVIHDWLELAEKIKKYAEKYRIKLMTPNIGQLVSTKHNNVFKNGGWVD